VSLFVELKRRNVVKVVAAYAIVSWLLVQIADVFFPALQLPEWTVTLVAALLILGLPIAILLSWAYELTPDGVKRTKSVPLSESVTQITGRKLDFVIISLLAAAVVFMFVDSYLPQSGPFAGAAVDPASFAPEPAATSPVSSSAAEDTQSTGRPNSVAVLPFDNLSPDPNDAYFAAGLHDEILSQLAKVQSLSVISRTSVLRYEDSDLSIPEIASQLNVETIMEGSVRYANNRVRITTQLIDADTDEHLWSETYDRDFDDIFAIESDIAMNIANALEAEFSVAEQQRLAEIPTSSSAAYALYLRAIADSTGTQAIEALDRAIALDPEFAEAYGFKALRLSQRMRTTEVDEEQLGAIVQENVEQALALDPNVATAHAASAALHAASWRWAEAKQAYDRVYELNPNNAEVLWAYGNFLRDVGAYDDSVRVFERAQEIDAGLTTYQLGISYRYAGNLAAASEAFAGLVELQPAVGQNHMQLGITQIIEGDLTTGAESVQIAEQLGGEALPPNRIVQIALAYSYADRPNDVDRLLAEFERRAEEIPVGNIQWATYHLARHEYDEAFERLEALLADPAGEFRYGQIKANDFRDPVLNEPEWQALRDRLGALE